MDENEPEHDLVTEVLGSDTADRKKPGKFQPFRKLFGKRRKKGSLSAAENGNLEPSQSSENVCNAALSSDDETNDDLRSPNNAMGTRAFSHESIFIPDGQEEDEQTAQTMSQDNILGKVKTLQQQLVKNIKFGQPPTTHPARRMQDTAEDKADGDSPSDPMEVLNQLDAALSDNDYKSSDSPDALSPLSSSGAGVEEEAKQGTPVKPARSKRPITGSSTIQSINLDAVPRAVARLDNSAAKHKLSVKPKNQRQSKKHKLSKHQQNITVDLGELQSTDKYQYKEQYLSKKWQNTPDRNTIHVEIHAQSILAESKRLQADHHRDLENDKERPHEDERQYEEERLLGTPEKRLSKLEEQLKKEEGRRRQWELKRQALETQRRQEGQIQPELMEQECLESTALQHLADEYKEQEEQKQKELEDYLQKAEQRHCESEEKCRELGEQKHVEKKRQEEEKQKEQEEIKQQEEKQERELKEQKRRKLAEQQHLEERRREEEEKQKELEEYNRMEELRQHEVEEQRREHAEKQHIEEERKRLEKQKQDELEERRRLEEQREREVQEQKRRELVEKQRREEERRKLEEKREKELEEHRILEEKRRRELEEQERREQAEKQRLEEERKRLELQKQKELEERRRLEEQRQRELEEQKRRELAEKQRLEKERKKLEEQKQRELEERRRLEEQRERELEEQKTRELAEKQRLEEERKRLEQQKQKELEERRRLEEQRQRELEEQKRREIAEKQRLEEERKREEEHKLRQLEERRKLEQQRLEEERKKQEEQIQKEVEERRRQEEQRHNMLEDQRHCELEEKRELEKRRQEDQRKQQIDERKQQELKEQKESLPDEKQASKQAPQSQRKQVSMREQERIGEELKWQEVDQRQTMPRPYTFQVSSGEKQIIFQKVNLSPVTPSKEPAHSSDKKEPKGQAQSKGSHALSSSMSVPHTAILVTGAQLCGTAVNLNQIKDTACKSLLGLTEDRKTMDYLPQENKTKVREHDVKPAKTKFSSDALDNQAMLAEWASIRSRILKGAENGKTNEQDLKSNSRCSDDWTNKGKSDFHGNLRKTLSASAKFSITPAWQKFPDTAKTEPDEEPISPVKQEDKKVEITAPKSEHAIQDEDNSMSLAHVQKMQEKDTSVIEKYSGKVDNAEGCKFAKDLPSFLVPSPPQSPSKGLPQTHVPEALDSQVANCTKKTEKNGQNGEEKTSPFGIKLRRTNYSLRFHYDQQGEQKKKKRYSAGDSFDGVPIPLIKTDSEQETQKGSLKQFTSPHREYSNASSNASKDFSTEGFGDAALPILPPINSHIPSSGNENQVLKSLTPQKPSLSPKPATPTPPSSPLARTNRLHISETSVHGVTKTEGCPEDLNVGTVLPPLLTCKNEEEESKEKKSFFPSINIPWREKADKKPELGRKDKPVLQSRHSIDGSRLPEKVETAQPLWITLALQKQKGFREQQATREERKQAREAKQAEKLAKENVGVSNQGASRGSPLQKSAVPNEEKKIEIPLSSVERREQFKKSNTLPTSVTVEISDPAPSAPLVKDVSKRFSTPDATPLSTEPAWLALAKRKAKAWSDCPQIIK